MTMATTSDTEQEQGDESGQPRQVIPDVSKSAEIFGLSIMALLRAYSPAMVILFYGINMSPEGMTVWFAVVGGVAAVVTTFVVLATPNGDTPGEYAWYIIQTRTGQGVLIHE